MNILVLSGADHLRFPTLLNHRLYADRNNYRYCFDMTAVQNVSSPYFHKLMKIADALHDADWVFWIDDDAAFTQFETKLEDLVPEMRDPDVHAIFCKSPVNLKGGWTHVSSGNFLLRNSEVSRNYLIASKEELLPKVKAWWDERKYGLFTAGDQDVLVYLMETDALIKRSTRILEYERFNTRPYHFQRKSQHFLVHFTNQPNRSKLDQMHTFAQLQEQSVLLVPEEALGAYGRYPQLLLNMLKIDR